MKTVSLFLLLATFMAILTSVSCGTDQHKPQIQYIHPCPISINGELTDNDIISIKVGSENDGLLYFNWWEVLLEHGDEEKVLDSLRLDAETTGEYSLMSNAVLFILNDDPERRFTELVNQFDSDHNYHGLIFYDLFPYIMTYDDHGANVKHIVTPNKYDLYIEPFVKHITSANSDLAVMGIRVVQHYPEEPAVLSTILNCYDNDNPMIRNAVSEALLSITEHDSNYLETPNAIRVLCQMLMDDSTVVRQNACKTGKHFLYNPTVRERMLYIVNYDEFDDIRLLALDSMYQGNPYYKANKILLSAIRNNNSHVRHAAIKYLVKLNFPHLTILVIMLLSLAHLFRLKLLKRRSN